MAIFSYLGSCLSAHIAKHLQHSGHSLAGSLCHSRSDVLIDRVNMLDTGGGLSAEDIHLLLKIIEHKNDEKKLKIIERQLIENSKNKFDQFMEHLKISDFVIFDNQYDLVRIKGRIMIDQVEHVVSNVGLSLFGLPYKNEGMLSDSLLCQYDSLHKTLIKINPNIQLIFIQYPILNGENLTDGRRERVRRSKLTSKCRSTWPFMSTPLYTIDVQYAAAENINHFKLEVYVALSAIVLEMFDKGVSPQKESEIVPLKDYCSETIPISPYADLPQRQYWKPAVAEPYPLAISDLYRKKFPIAPQDSIATCGSCFAQHIGKRMRDGGYRYVDLEPAPPELNSWEAKAQGYGLYSARYGNVYTSRQLLQLFQRAFDQLRFTEAWQNPDGRFVDPFRPNLCGEGFASAEGMLADQAAHLRHVRRLFETLDVFVFTMGLTETWHHRETGAVYPLCPGVSAGTYDPAHHAFVNLDYATILNEMEEFLARLKTYNPKARVILTVSPVPLTATAEDRHVLISTMASKSILRAVADRLYQAYAHVDYFPSYDIILSPPYKSMFFKNNLRSIHEKGVDYVMSHFFGQHHLNDAVPATVAAEQTGALTWGTCGTIEYAEGADEAFCDEAFLELERQQDNQTIGRSCA